MKKDNLYDLCWRYIFISDAIDCVRPKKERIIDFCCTPFYIRGMSAKLKKRILEQGKVALEKLKQQIEEIL